MMKKFVYFVTLIAFSACTTVPQGSLTKAEKNSTTTARSIASDTDRWLVIFDSNIALEPRNLIIRSANDGGHWIYTCQNHEDFLRKTLDKGNSVLPYVENRNDELREKRMAGENAPDHCRMEERFASNSEYQSFLSKVIDYGAKSGKSATVGSISGVIAGLAGVTGFGMGINFLAQDYGYSDFLFEKNFPKKARFIKLKNRWIFFGAVAVTIVAAAKARQLSEESQNEMQFKIIGTSLQDLAKLKGKDDVLTEKVSMTRVFNSFRNVNPNYKDWGDFSKTKN